MMLFVIPVIAAVVMTVYYAIEQHDKDMREQNNLPARKYHDIVDQDVTAVFTVRHK